MSKLTFSDGEEFDTDGEYRITSRSDGLYVVGRGFLCAVETRTEGDDLIANLKRSSVKVDKSALVKAAYELVYEDEMKLIEACTMERAILDTGSELKALITPSDSMKPEHVIKTAYQTCAEQQFCEAVHGHLDAERRGWLKGVERDVKLVKKMKLPMTVANVRHALMRTGPFKASLKSV